MNRTLARRVILSSALSFAAAFSIANYPASAQTDQGETAIAPDQSSGGTAGANPGVMPQPFRTVDIPELRGKVIEIFEFGCPYCRALNDQLLQWGSTLPPSWSFDQLPSLIGPEFFNMSLAYLAEQSADPKALPAFETHCFSLIQDEGEAIGDIKTYMEAAQSSGTDLGAYHSALDNPANEAVLEDIAKINEAAAIKATPTLIIDGRYAITPNDTGGNFELFINLANGLISQSMSNGTAPPISSPPAS